MISNDVMSRHIVLSWQCLNKRGSYARDLEIVSKYSIRRLLVRNALQHDLLCKSGNERIDTGIQKVFQMLGATVG